MDTGNLITSIPAGCDIAITMVSLELIAHGYYVANTFKIDSACGSFVNNICAHRGESPCKCKLRVLQVFDKPTRSVNIIFHTNRDITELYLDCEEAEAQRELESQLRRILLQESSMLRHLITAKICQYV